MEKPKTNPFRVPGDYFDTLPDRLSDRIAGMEAGKAGMEAEEVPVKKLGSRRTILAVAAAIAAMAMLTFPLVRMLTPGTEADDNFVEIALLDGAGFFSSDYEMAAYLEEASMDDEEAYLSQAVEYLESNAVEMDFIFE